MRAGKRRGLRRSLRDGAGLKRTQRRAVRRDVKETLYTGLSRHIGLSEL